MNFSGMIYVESRFGGTLLSAGVTDAAITDSDGLRGNAAGEALLTATTPFSAPRSTPLTSIDPRTGQLVGPTEVIATVQFTDGTFLSLLGIVRDAYSAYGGSSQTWLFDDAALAAAGKSLGDIAQVVSRANFDHALNWEDLGFVAGGGLPQPNDIIGTNRADTLTGTDGVDEIRGLGGNDTLSGGGDEDAFVFGAETRNGRRETDVIRNYDIDRDYVILDNTPGNAVSEVRSITNIDGGVRITFFGDRDVINIFGDGLTVGTLNVGTFDTIF